MAASITVLDSVGATQTVATNDAVVTQLQAPVGQFGELKTVEKTPLVEICSAFPQSILREIGAVTGSATSTTTGGERRLQTTASGADAYTLLSAERGRYQPGYAAECGIGVRIPVAPVGNQYATWGYSDGTANGLYFGVDATGLYVARLSNSVQTLVRQSSWNADKMNGTGLSGLTLDLTRGNIFQIVFSWYGYGVIEFQVVVLDALGKQQVIVVHRIGVTGSVSIQEPNLPIMATVANGGTAAAFNMYVGGRQFAIVGKHQPSSRTTSARQFLLAGITTTLTPVVSIRRKVAFYNVPTRISGIECIATGNCQVVAMLNATLTTPSWTSLPDTIASETAVEQDVAALTMSGGNSLYSALVDATGSNKSQSGMLRGDGLSIDIPEGQTVTLAVRAFTGTVTASALVRMAEDW